MTLEAAAGKNVVSHVGKSYSIVAHKIANELIAKCPDIAEATCVLVSRIGQTAEMPQIVELQIRRAMASRSKLCENRRRPSRAAVCEA